MQKKIWSTILQNFEFLLVMPMSQRLDGWILEGGEQTPAREPQFGLNVIVKTFK
jgi:hypothetical protein